MIWHFSELGWDKSLWTCNNGNVSYSNPDCKLDTKPQPQWVENWVGNTARANVYNQWAKQIELRINENVFENGQHAWNFSQTGRPRLDVWTSSTPQSSLSYVFVLTNFSDATYNASGGFPYTGNWVNLMDNSVVNVTSTTQNVSIEPGGYRIFGNQPATLSNPENQITSVKLYPNPANNYFVIEGEISKAEIYSVTGQLVKSFDGVNTTDYQFDINDLTKGVYLVKAFDAQNRTKTMKLIKQ